MGYFWFEFAKEVCRGRWGTFWFEFAKEVCRGRWGTFWFELLRRCAGVDGVLFV